MAVHVGGKESTVGRIFEGLKPGLNERGVVDVESSETTGAYINCDRRRKRIVKR